ncbi:hypothetical protein ACJJTC_004360 [Scirpophaga incertulas]
MHADLDMTSAVVSSSFGQMAAFQAVTALCTDMYKIDIIIGRAGALDGGPGTHFLAVSIAAVTHAALARHSTLPNAARRAPTPAPPRRAYHPGLTVGLSSIVQGRILAFFGHVSRRDDTSVERLVVQGSVEGTRARGRSPMRCTDQVKTAVDGSLYECTRRAAVREEWRRLVKRATEP